ncbi:peptidylprolyl isomerase [Leptospira stimsonii]|uniref:peptidylprolyl isomerase n=1 Tax=Leptospira stimsonii TaxID=2202203 RepID=A0ABY2MYG1_9LEPT|nr:peptidylprolyl isomerase [Leptospira stimsonii]TGK14456.1 peptidyl-prolyl cis-trans isomerase [Leptospira stimsonii]TGM11819.1 peptidyl-prolyl cis-trans isomerase [Leptospira stimsonii]
MFFKEVSLWRNPELFLTTGAVFGFLLAVVGLIYPERENLLTDSIAEVNGNQIQKDEYFRALSGYASDTRNPIDETVKRRILDRLIEEELLVQRGLELGYANQDRAIRSKIVNAVIQSVISEQVSRKPNEFELRTYFFSNREKFAHSARYKVVVYMESDEDSAKQLVAMIRKKIPISLSSKVEEVPSGFLPLRKILDYLGTDLVGVLVRLKPGEVSDPVKSGGGYSIIQLLEQEPGQVPAFHSIRNEVEASYIHEKGDEALREYLDWLRSKAKIEIADLGE